MIEKGKKQDEGQFKSQNGDKTVPYNQTKNVFYIAVVFCMTTPTHQHLDPHPHPSFDLFPECLTCHEAQYGGGHLGFCVSLAGVDKHGQNHQEHGHVDANEAEDSKRLKSGIPVWKKKYIQELK